MSEQTKKNNKKLWIGAAALVVLIAVFALIYNFAAPKGTTGGKNIVVEVIVPDQDAKEFKISTDEEFLSGALKQEKLIEGEDGEYGFFVTTVDGLKADDTKQEWWCFTKNKEQLNTGVDATPIADGDHFEVTLTVGY